MSPKLWFKKRPLSWSFSCYPDMVIANYCDLSPSMLLSVNRTALKRICYIAAFNLFIYNYLIGARPQWPWAPIITPPHSRKRENHRQVLCLKTLSCPDPRKREREKLREWKENTSLSSQNISATLCPRVDANNFFDIFPDQTQWGSNRLVWLNWEETRKSAFFVKRWRFFTQAMQLIFLCRKLKI